MHGYPHDLKGFKVKDKVIMEDISREQVLTSFTEVPASCLLMKMLTSRSSLYSTLQAERLY